ncbi:autophagy-related 8i [Olea europaea subsp. europaea]|uniref:Autophagy-related protein n=1 Tax=Olea europaea subsp. europaea TaxID=158383 RepID=A0A8S0VHV0_OLEEU|nr:autophagy-related 8i [Olea europaea subsp. europaea]
MCSTSFNLVYIFFGNRYLVPRDMSVGQFIYILSGRLHLAPGKALFVFVNNTLPQTSSLVETLYDSSKDEDGFLYMCYSSEKTFGYAQ